MKLTERQGRFVVAFLGDAAGNATKAALAAGCSRGNAAATAWRWLRNVKVQAALVEKREKRELVTENTAEARERWLLAFINNEQLDASDRLKAFDILCKCSGVYMRRDKLDDTDLLASLLGRSRELENAAP